MIEVLKVVLVLWAPLRAPLPLWIRFGYVPPMSTLPGHLRLRPRRGVLRVLLKEYQLIWTY